MVFKVASLSLWTSTFLVVSLFSVMLTSAKTIEKQQKRAVPVDECTVDCSFSNPGSFVPDPFDCHKYYGCLEDGTPTDSPLTCPEGEYFDPSWQDCETEYSPCQDLCKTPGCSLSCASGTEFIANPRNCSEYYICTPDGGATLGSCTPDQPYFNGQTCSTEEFNCCDPCKVECPEPGLEIPDPYDCRKYYFCGTSDQPFSLDCPEGQVFDPLVAKCVEGDTCRAICAYTTTRGWDPTTTTAPWWYSSTTTSDWWETTTYYNKKEKQ